MAKLWKFVKVLFYTITTIVCIALIAYFTLEAVLPEEEFNSIKSWLNTQYENLLDTLENVKDWFVDNFSQVNEDATVEGIKLCEVGDFQLSRYIDITIPYNYMVTTMNTGETQIEETIVIYNDSIMAILYLQDVELSSDAPSINRYRKEMIKSLSSQYSDYDFAYGDVIDNKVGVIDVTINDEDSKMYIAVAALGSKTLVINYIYNIEFEAEAENYFSVILREVSNSIK